MSLTANAIVYCAQSDVEAILSVDGVLQHLADNNDNTVTADQLAYLTLQGINWATAKINDFCRGRYDPEYLAQSWTANEWCATLAAWFVARRRGNPVMKSLKEHIDEQVLPELLDLRKGEYQIQDIPQRVTGQPGYSNMRVDQRYRLFKIRKERQISDQVPTQNIPVRPDRQSDWVVEYSWFVPFVLTVISWLWLNGCG